MHNELLLATAAHFNFAEMLERSGEGSHRGSPG